MPEQLSVSHIRRMLNIADIRAPVRVLIVGAEADRIADTITPLVGDSHVVVLDHHLPPSHTRANSIVRLQGHPTQHHAGMAMSGLDRVLCSGLQTYLQPPHLRSTLELWKGYLGSKPDDIRRGRVAIQVPSPITRAMIETYANEALCAGFHLCEVNEFPWVDARPHSVQDLRRGLQRMESVGQFIKTADRFEGDLILARAAKETEQVNAAHAQSLLRKNQYVVQQNVDPLDDLVRRLVWQPARTYLAFEI